MTDPEIETRIVEIIRSRNPSLDLTSAIDLPLNEIGVDSIELLNIVFEIEESFGIVVEDEDLRRLATANDLLQLVRSLMGKGATEP